MNKERLHEVGMTRPQLAALCLLNTHVTVNALSQQSEPSASITIAAPQRL